MRPFRILAVILLLVLLADVGCIVKLQYDTAKTQAYIQAMEEDLAKYR